MLIPKNGKIIILDDKMEQAKSLIQELSKNKIPFTYYNGEQEQLPLTPHDDVRMIFIDINLTDGTNAAAIKSQLQLTLQRLIKPETTYIAAIWSIKENEYNDLLNDLFDNKIPYLKPIARISLAKNELFTIDLDTGHYIENPKVNILYKINKKLELELGKIRSLKAIIIWENIIMECSDKIISQITSIVEKDDNWNDNIRHVLYKMAHAQLGKNLLSSTEREIVKASLQTFNSSFIDLLNEMINSSSLMMPSDIKVKSKGIDFMKRIEGKDMRLKWEDLKTNVLYVNGTERNRNGSIEKLKGNNDAEQIIVDKFKAIYSVVSPSINATLLLNKNASNKLHPGNIYKKNISGRKKRKLLKTYFKDIEKKRKNNIQSKADNGKTLSFEVADISDIRFIELECTPICDYSQKKWLRSRILPGIMYPATFYKMLEQTVDSFYREIPPFLYKGEIYRLVFDYRLFKSVNLENDTNKPEDFLFKLKTEVLSDIQARVSSHINRPGITTVS